jgi:hypothetical protein
MPTPQRDLEQEIERLVRELGQVVRSADPEKQDQLKSSLQPPDGSGVCSHGTKRARRSARGAAAHEPARGRSRIACPRCRPFLFRPTRGSRAGHRRVHRHCLGNRGGLYEKVVNRSTQGLLTGSSSGLAFQRSTQHVEKQANEDQQRADPICA